MNLTTNLILVDDTPAILDLTEKLLEDIPDIQVIDTALSGPDLLEKLAFRKRTTEVLSVDFILLDMIMEPVDGWEITKQVKELYPHIKIIAFSSRDYPQLAHRSIECGADGFLSKYHFSVELLRQAIRQIRSGQQFLMYDENEEKGQYNDSVPLYLLTPREREIIQLLSQGANRQAIAANLMIRLETLDVFLENIKSKLSVYSNQEIVEAAKKFPITDKAPDD